jgi:hypothetical protein
MVEVEANDAVEGAASAPLLDQAAIAAKARSLYRGLSLAPMVRASTTPLRALALQ